MYKIIIGNIDELKNSAFKIRNKVFVKEQNVPQDIEWDERDKFCKHIVIKDKDKPIATGRIDIDGKIGRVAVIKEYRKKGIGTLIMKELEKVAKELKINRIYFNSQSYAVPFYKKLGYIVISDSFYEAGIEHKKMEKNI